MTVGVDAPAAPDTLMLELLAVVRDLGAEKWMRPKDAIARVTAGTAAERQAAFDRLVAQGYLIKERAKGRGGGWVYGTTWPCQADADHQFHGVPRPADLTPDLRPGALPGFTVRLEGDFALKLRQIAFSRYRSVAAVLEEMVKTELAFALGAGELESGEERNW